MQTQCKARLSARLFTLFWRCRYLLLSWGFVQAAIVNDDSSDCNCSFAAVYWLAAIFLSLVPLLVHCNYLGARSARSLEPDSPLGLRGRRCWNTGMVLVALAIFITLLTTGYYNASQVFSTIGAAISLSIFIFDGLAMAVTGTWLVGRKDLTRWSIVRSMNQLLHSVSGTLILIGQLIVASLPCLSEMQTRCLFNVEFSERLQVADVFAKEANRQNVV